MPSTSERLAYSLVAGIALPVLAALVAAVAGTSDLVAAVLLLALAALLWWLAARNQATIVRGKDVIVSAAVLWLVCAGLLLIDGFPYQAALFLVAAAALGFALLLLRRGVVPVELRVLGILAVAAPNRLHHLRMLEELRDVGILTPDEFAAKRVLAGG